MGIPYGLKIINKLLLSLPVQWGHIKNLITLMISRVESLFHFENINFQGRADYMHQFHLAKKDVHHGLVLRKQFILLQNHCGVNFVHLDNMSYQKTSCPTSPHIQKLANHMNVLRRNEINKKTIIKVKTYLSNINNCKLCSFITL